MAQHGLLKMALATAVFALLPQGVGAASLEEREAVVKENPLKDAYFGETHLHSPYSLDAFIGGARLGPDDAYRVAKGETVTLNGQQHNIVKPLDFAAVTDHAEFIGEMLSAQVEGAKGYDNEQLVKLRGLTSFEEQEAWFVKYVQGPARAGAMGHPPFWAGEEPTRSAWQMMVDTARTHYEPGVFPVVSMDVKADVSVATRGYGSATVRRFDGKTDLGDIILISPGPLLAVYAIVQLPI